MEYIKSTPNSSTPRSSTPREVLNKSYLKKGVSREKIENFKRNAKELLQNINTQESEEHNKNHISDFLKKTYYEPHYSINTKKATDLVIREGKNKDSAVGVIIETKRPSNEREMPHKDGEQYNLNVKAMHELMLYYMRERENKLNIKNLIISDGYKWFIFDAEVFEKVFYQNKDFQKQYQDFKNQRLPATTTEFFYKEIAQKFIQNSHQKIEFTYFDLREYKKTLIKPIVKPIVKPIAKNIEQAKENEQSEIIELIALYKILSPQHLLKLPLKNDSNSLDKGFYKELLHIIGLNEIKSAGKKLIQRKPENQRDAGSLLENTINQLETGNKLQNLKDPHYFGNPKGSEIPEQLFQVALELCLTWINRILFLKLLESQLLSYHKKDKTYAFLNTEKIANYDKLNSLFFEVLAKESEQRSPDLKREFGKVPYLNSSLFEPSQIEIQTLSISNLDDNKTIPLFSATVLKDATGKKQKENLQTLDYFFQFLDAYDFSSEGKEDIKEDEKTLISASVLGLIFEKINGYKEGSFFTPGFITMYIAKETLQKAVITKFNQAKNWSCQNLNEIHNKIHHSQKTDFTKEANQIFNSLRICDPAVGSGHFLVSALNELIAIKSKLGILCDQDGKILTDYQAEVQEDELSISNNQGTIFQYEPQNRESQRIQKALFCEKQTLIENCLFGVDINHNSVKICRLRLWIELLKNAYYNMARALETLPNIDINIKCGNSLTSRFELKDEMVTEAASKNIESYRKTVQAYYHTRSKEKKQEIEKQISTIKKNYADSIKLLWSAERKKLSRLRMARNEKHNSQLFDTKLTKEQVLQQAKAIQTSMQKETKLEQKITEAESNKIHKNALEWRFEFPAVLDNEGNFVGFDAIIGNPPYIRQEAIKEFKALFQNKYQVYKGTADIFTYFVEQGYNLLKENGTFQFIVSNKFARANYGAALRKFLLKNTLTHFIDFSGLAVFDEATVDACILGFQKKQSSENQLLVADIQKNNFKPADFEEILSKISQNFSQKNLTEQAWTFGSPLEIKLKTKIETIGTPLKDWDLKINYGIKTGYNEAFIINQEKKDELVKADPKSAEIIKPILRGRDIKAYEHNWAGLYLINSHNGDKKNSTPPINIDDYPVIREHLHRFYPALEKRQDQGATPYNLRDCAYLKELEKEKIVYPETTQHAHFFYDKEKFFIEKTGFIMIVKDSLEYICALLNSNLITFYFKTFGSGAILGKSGYQYNKHAFENLPIPKITAKEQQPFITLVDKILQAKAQRKDTTELQTQIDKLTYQLYNLTKEEITTIENKKHPQPKKQ